VVLETPQRGAKKAVVDHACKNAQEALTRKLVESASTEKNLAAVQKLFGLEKIPERIEVYDNSHIQGQFAVGAMIVAGKEGFIKNAYRKFTIQNRLETRGARHEEKVDISAAPAFKDGDDYGMMREVFTRRFSRALKENTVLPDLVLIDGGAGQLSTVMAVMQELGLEHVPLVGIAKGVDRNAGRERFFLPNKHPFTLPPNDPVLFYLQRLRDEVHRFAITTHRAKRSKAITQNTLDEVAGIGAARKKALLQHFGSAKAVKDAALQDLENVRGISKAIARKVYEHFHA
jgi:excinuclease ABC subunit C